jgi:hypothetical protein
VTGRQRRKLSAVDDPLGAPPPPTPGPPAPAPLASPPAPRAGARDGQALFVRLPVTEAEALARAAFELRLHKREVVAALIARHVDPTSADGLERVRRLVEDYRARG